ncbi:hypothetical protein C8Q79DRAFT_1010843 [Trametes meyenii]|nr:hypothetical protein C8Q79DRAFT_1010843 [Trametes meyenii]
MASQSTPRSLRGEQHPAKAHEDIKRESHVQIEGWASELNGRVLEFPHNVDEFIDTLLPCSTPYELDENLADAFSQYAPMRGKREKESYPGLIRGLEALIAPFAGSDRGNRIPLVAETHNTVIHFPFDAFVNHHHYTLPDISFSFPGADNFTHGSWQHISMVIEAKGKEEDDPFPRKGLKNVRTVEQLAKNARNLMLTHGFLCSFVIGIYGHIIRLVRFDHTCALVSEALDLREDGSAKTLQRFLWHFVHPLIGDTVVGCDPTVSKLDDSSQEWVKKQLKEGCVPKWEKHTGELAKGRRVEVYDQKTGRCIPYLLYHLVDVNGRLFSRATMVWRALEDTRIWKGGRLVDDPKRPKPPKPQILKEAWRQLVRPAEATFYDRINMRISEEERYGIPKMVYGGDIGEFEFRWWEESGKRWGREEDPEDGPSEPQARRRPTRVSERLRSRARLNKVSDGSKKADKPSTSSPPLLFSSIGSAGSPFIGDLAEPNTHYTPKGEFPMIYPQHQTYSWRLAQGETSWHHERSHMRIVIDDVGRSLTEFTSTHELVTAVRDAIIGHRLLWEKAEILHRDVSVGNILIKDVKKEEDKFTGFLHDYDYSSMVPDSDTPTDRAQNTSEEAYPELRLAPTDAAKDSDDPTNQKERTGTYYFMAFEILKVPDMIHNTHHDLESFYWVLLWVVVRHTDHGRGKEICNRIFKYGDDEESANAKRCWLEDAVQSDMIPDNKPLSYLLKELTALVQEQLPTTRRNAQQILLTYDAILEVFDKALATPGWPENDWRPCTLLTGDGRTGIAPVMTAAPQEIKLASSRPIRALPTRRTAPVPDKPPKKTLPPHPSHAHLPAPFTGPMTHKMLKRPSACLDNAEDTLERAAAGLRSDASRMSKRRKYSMGPPALPDAKEDLLDTRSGRSASTSRRESDSEPSIHQPRTRSSSRLRKQKKETN